MRLLTACRAARVPGSSTGPPVELAPQLLMLTAAIRLLLTTRTAFLTTSLTNGTAPATDITTLRR